VAADGPRGASGGGEGGLDAGVLAVWRTDQPPVSGALRVDPGAFSASGEAACVSLVLPDEAMRPAFDDLAVQQARRVLLAGPPPAVGTPMLADNSHFAAALSARRRSGRCRRATS